MSPFLRQHMISPSPHPPSLFSSMHCTQSLIPLFSPKHLCPLCTQTSANSAHLSEVFLIPPLLHLNRKAFTVYISDLFVCVHASPCFWHRLPPYAHSPYPPPSRLNLECGFLLMKLVSKTVINYEYQ